MKFAIKAAIDDHAASTLVFTAQKTMYGGKRIAPGDGIFLFASEIEGGAGLVARGIVCAARAVPRRPGIERQTPRVTVEVRLEAHAARRLGRAELRSCDAWDDGRPETELNFRLYRQATNKLIGLSDDTATFLAAFF
jgi:hypothetical protein